MKKTNKGFSLVELIIVIAIMAILAGAIAPALIRYIDKSRRSNDVTACKTIKTAIETALGTEDVYAILTNTSGSKCSVIDIEPNKSTKATAGEKGVTISGCTKPSDCDLEITDAEVLIAQNIGEKTPKLKYKKAADGNTDHKPTGHFIGLCSPGGTVYVVIPWGSGDEITVKDNSVECTWGYPICPYIDKNYQ